jgi:hypothetical protein
MYIKKKNIAIALLLALATSASNHAMDLSDLDYKVSATKKMLADFKSEYENIKNEELINKNPCIRQINAEQSKQQLTHDVQTLNAQDEKELQAFTFYQGKSPEDIKKKLNDEIGVLTQQCIKFTKFYKTYSKSKGPKDSIPPYEENCFVIFYRKDLPLPEEIKFKTLEYFKALEYKINELTKDSKKIEETKELAKFETTKELAKFETAEFKIIAMFSNGRYSDICHNLDEVEDKYTKEVNILKYKYLNFLPKYAIKENRTDLLQMLLMDYKKSPFPNQIAKVFKDAIISEYALDGKNLDGKKPITEFFLNNKKVLGENSVVPNYIENLISLCFSHIDSKKELDDFVRIISESDLIENKHIFWENLLKTEISKLKTYSYGKSLDIIYLCLCEIKNDKFMSDDQIMEKPFMKNLFDNIVDILLQYPRAKQPSHIINGVDRKHWNTIDAAMSFMQNFNFPQQWIDSHTGLNRWKKDLEKTK